MSDTQNTIDALRSELFATLRELRNKEAPMDIERAHAVGEIAQTIINSAKVEVDHMKIAGGSGTGFLGTPAGPTPRGDEVKQVPGGRIVTHRLKG